MATLTPVPPETFESIQNVDIDRLSTLPESSIRAILPCLVRMSLCHPLDTSEKWTSERKTILKCLSGIEVVNSLVGLLSIDFHALELDAKKEQQMRSKIDGNLSESILISQLEQGPALEFERSDAARKLRLLLSELLFISSQMKEVPKGEFYHKNSELFESEVYLEEVSDVLCIAQAELPGLLPITEVAETLLHVHNGPWLLSRLVANVPDTFHEVCVSLITRGETDEGELGVQRRSDALKVLCNMCPSQALVVRRLCVEHLKLPGLAIALTLQHSHMSQRQKRIKAEPSSEEESLNEVVAFVSGLLFEGDPEVRKWFSQYFKSGQKKSESESIIHALRQEILDQMISLLPSGPPPCSISEDKVVHACVFIRLYCTLKGIANMRFKDDELQALVSLMTCRPPPSAAGIRFICLSLCTVLACPNLMSSLENERQTADWIKWLVQEGSHFENLSGVKASFGELLLLVAIFFHVDKPDIANTSISALLNVSIGIEGVVKASSIANSPKIRMIFTQEIFNEEVVAKHAVQVAVTKGLNAESGGICLPVHCVYYLLQGRAFSKHKVPVKDWIYHQLCECTTPLSSIVMSLIKAYVNSILIVKSKNDRCNDPIEEHEIQAVINPRSKGPVTPQVLLLYYVLHYEDVRQSHMKQIVASGRKVHSYSAQFMSQLPMKSLLQHVQKDQGLYGSLLPALLKLLVNHYPHLCLVEDWLDELTTEVLPSSALISPPDIPCTAENLKEAFADFPQSSSLLLILLQKLSAKPASDLPAFIDPFTSNLHKLLSTEATRRLRDVAKSVWLKCHTISPTEVRVKTVNSLSGSSHFSNCTEDSLTLDPLTVLRCDPRVFRCPPLMEITMRILEGFLQASKAYLSTQLQLQVNSEPAVPAGAAAPLPGQTPLSIHAEQEELMNALIAAQDSAVIQMLLEVCLPKKDEKESASLLSDLREIQCLVCMRLHQMFIADPTLAKLVHFQGYAPELLPVTVAGIPSMHICLDFIPELISQPHLEKRMFAIELVSYLSVQYALPKSLGIARLAVNVMTTLVKVLPNDDRPDFFLATIPAMARIARAFPPLCDDVIALLLQVGQVCRAHLAIYSGECQDSSGSFLDNLPREGHGGLLVMKKMSQQQGGPISDLSKYSELFNVVHKTFSEICQSTVLLKQMMH